MSRARLQCCYPCLTTTISRALSTSSTSHESGNYLHSYLLLLFRLNFAISCLILHCNDMFNLTVSKLLFKFLKQCNKILTYLDHLLVQGRPLFELSSISDLVPCLQSVGIYSCLPLRCPFISFLADLCSFSPKLPVLAISHRCGWVLVSSSGQTTLNY